MKTLIYLKLFLVVVIVSINTQNSCGQYVYGISDIVYDKKTKTVLGISRTTLDYEAALYYDPAVINTMYEEEARIYTADNSQPISNFTITALTYNSSQTSSDTVFSVFSDHFVIAYFGMQKTIDNSADSDSDSHTSQQTKRKWYDALGFNRFGGSQDISWYKFRGSNMSYTFADQPNYILGSTYRGVVTNP